MTIETNPDGSTKRVFIAACRISTASSIVDFAERKRSARIELPDEPSGVDVIHHRLGSPSHGIGVAPDNKTLWVTSILANAVFVYSLPDLKLHRPRGAAARSRSPGAKPMAAVPNWVTFTPDSKQI